VGELVHRILRRFYDGFARGAGEAWRARAAERLLAIAREAIARAPRTDAFGRAAAARLVSGLDDREAPRGPLAVFLDAETEAEDGLAPLALERSLTLDVGDARVAGIVDRVDAGEVGGEAALVVYDYKTGARPPVVRGVIEGRSFQLPFYLLAARAIAPDARPLGAAFFALGDATHREPRRWFAPGDAPGVRILGQRLLRDRAAFEAAIARAPDAIAAAIDGMRAGRFHPGSGSPQQKGCRHCDYSRVCRVDHARMEALAARPGAPMFRPLPLVEEAVP
jgi:hypothetical protein